MMGMFDFIQLLVIFFFFWFSIYTVVDRICRCLEFRASVKSGANGIEKIMKTYINNRSDSNK